MHRKSAGAAVVDGKIRRTVTLKDIARTVGVSVATVSRVVNGKDRGRVQPDIAREVRRQAELLGYKPNLAARNLKTRTSRILGFISDEIATTPFAGRIMLGAQDAARELGYILLAVNTGNDPELENREINLMQQYDTDGFLYAMMYNRMVRVPPALGGQPVLLLDCEDQDGACPSICPDERDIGFQATRRLLAAGCRRVAYVGADVPLIAQTGRFAGYREAMAASPYGYDERYVVMIEEHDPGNAVPRLFDLQPDGVFCFNDVRAIPVYREAERRGLAIGRDVSVVGVDNQPLVAGILSPQLTSIELPHYEMGYWGVRKLVSLIEARHAGVEGGGPASSAQEREVAVSDAPCAVRPDGVHIPLPDMTCDRARISCLLVEKQSVADAVGRS